MTLLHAWWSRPGARSACGAVAAVVCLLLLLFAPWPPLAGQPSDATGGSYGSAPRTGALSAPGRAFDPRNFPAFLINGPEAYTQRKWAEQQLADIGYSSYTRVNALWLDPDDCANATKANCQEGLTLAHAKAWSLIATSPDTGALGYLVLEDDVTFHSHFRKLFPRYAAELPADFAVAYVGQLSRVVLDHDRGSKPLKVLLQSDVAPYTTHAYLVSRDGAALLANHLQFMLARAGSPHARAPFYMNADAPQQYPWALTALDVKIDFFMIETHRYMFSREGSLTRRPSWFTFESTKALPASFGRGGVRWAKNGDVQLGHANAGRCAADKPDYIPCEAALAAASPCGPSSRRLPIMGTGLAFQNQCRQQPFTLYAWAGSAKEAVPPTCAALRKRIAPNAASDPTPADCLDEGAVALQQRAVVPSAPEQGIQFSVPGSGMAPQPWDDLLKNTITAAGSPWIDRAKPPAVIVAHGMPCGRTGGRCDVPFSIRPGTTDSAVLGQVIARDEYGFLWKQHLPAPRIILDAGANCGIASVLFANLFPDATIVSVEPATDNFAALSTQIEPYASRIWAVNAALWGEHAALNVVKGARHGREWDNQIKADVAAADSKNAIAGNTVAELLQLHELPRFDFVKIDIEGSEKQVFEAQDLSWLDAASYVAVELHDDMMPGAQATVFAAVEARGSFCHTVSGEYNVWLNAKAPLMAGFCAERAARGLDCCGAPTK